ncbi:MAG: Lauroyl/myristoyl acyltransferase [Ilumatobacteraceae bacterium]|nr:Lauroyl/myristoyl acyltransferase [Ilumatobacteraceae bacterium]
MLPDPSYAAYRAGSAIARLLPKPVIAPFTDLAGWAAARAMDGRRDMVVRHQLRVRPDLTPEEVERAVDEVFRSYTQYWIESFRLPGTSAEALDRGLVTEGYEHVRAAYDAGNGVITAMPHLGAWEWAAFWLTASERVEVTTVVEPVQPPELADWFIELRERMGMEIVPLGPDSGARVAKALKAGRLLSLVCDRDIAGGGVEVEFFGELTTLPAGPATLALRSGAPLMAATCYFDGDGHRGVVRPPIDTTRHGKLREDVARVTQVLAYELEELIRLAPEQWHLLQPNWPSDRAIAESSR